MKIGLVLAAVPGYSETFFRSKIRGLQEQGHEVVLFVPASNRGTKINCEVAYGPVLSKGIVTRTLASTKALANVLKRAPRQAMRFLKLEQQSGTPRSLAFRRLVINSHILPYKLDWLHFGFATMGIDRELVGKAVGAKVATSFRGYDVSIFPIKEPNCYRRLWQHLDKVHTISEDLKKVAVKQGLPPQVPVVKVPPAIEVDQFTIQGARTFVGAAEEVKLLTVGRLHWKKGYEYMIQAVALLKEQGLKLSYSIVGEGDQEERLRFAAYQLGVQEEVHFFGKVSHEEVSKLTAQHDIYLQYSIQEGFCNAVLEAQASGMLCVVSDAEGLSENVANEITGLVVPRGDVGLLADAIRNLHQLPADRKQAMSELAQERVQTHFRIEDQVRAFCQFYQ